MVTSLIKADVDQSLLSDATMSIRYSALSGCPLVVKTAT
jgi:hypothetical protein